MVLQKLYGGAEERIGDTPAWQELDELVGQVFDGVESLAPDEQSESGEMGAYAV